MVPRLQAIGGSLETDRQPTAEGNARAAVATPMGEGSWQARNVRLLDGRIVKSDSEPWRHQMEAESILKMPRNEREYLLFAIKSRDDSRHQALLATMSKLREKK